MTDPADMNSAKQGTLFLHTFGFVKAWKLSLAQTPLKQVSLKHCLNRACLRYHLHSTMGGLARIIINEANNKDVSFHHCVGRTVLTPCSKLVSLHKTVKNADSNSGHHNIRINLSRNKHLSLLKSFNIWPHLCLKSNQAIDSESHMFSDQVETGSYDFVFPKLQPGVGDYKNSTGLLQIRKLQTAHPFANNLLLQ